MFNKNKNGQFYLLAALLMCISVFGLLSSTYAHKEDKVNNNLLSLNYINEAKNVINQGLYSESDIDRDLREFTLYYISYAKTRNVDFQTAYLFKHDNKISIVNFLKNNLNITTINHTLANTEIYNHNLTTNIQLVYEETNYNFTFTNDDNEFKALVITN